jgi:hypothetical protein
MSGTQYQKAKEDAAAIMREKQKKGMWQSTDTIVSLHGPHKFTPN